jgi:hypothetical protein
MPLSDLLKATRQMRDLWPTDRDRENARRVSGETLGTQTATPRVPWSHEDTPDAGTPVPDRSL